MKNICINKKDLNKLYLMAEEIQGSLCIIQKFCKDYTDIDNFYCIMPLINCTLDKASDLHKKLMYIDHSNNA